MGLEPAAPWFPLEELTAALEACRLPQETPEVREYLELWRRQDLRREGTPSFQRRAERMEEIWEILDPGQLEYLWTYVRANQR